MGVLGVFRDSVVIVNRTDRVLQCRYDGEDIDIHPGENPGFPAVAVPYAKKQNPLMGSQHPINPTRYISLVGVKDTKDDVTPIPAAVLARADGQLERVDRDGDFSGEPMRKVRLLKKTGIDPYEALENVGGVAMDFNRNLE